MVYHSWFWCISSCRQAVLILAHADDKLTQGLPQQGRVAVLLAKSATEGFCIFVIPGVQGCRIAHLDRPYRDWPTAVTSVPADAMRLPQHGRIAVGLPANLVLFKGRGYSELLARPQWDRVSMPLPCQHLHHYVHLITLHHKAVGQGKLATTCITTLHHYLHHNTASQHCFTTTLITTCITTLKHDNTHYYLHHNTESLQHSLLQHCITTCITTLHHNNASKHCITTLHHYLHHKAAMGESIAQWCGLLGAACLQWDRGN